MLELNADSAGKLIVLDFVCVGTGNYRKLTENMKFHEAHSVTLKLLLCTGLYLPITVKLVKNKGLITLSRIYGWFMIIAFPVYVIALTLPLLFPNRDFSERLYSLSAGITSVNIVYKFYSFFYNIPRFERLIKIWDEFNGQAFYPQLRKELLQKRKKSTDFIIRSSTVVFILSMIAVFVSPFYTRKLEHPTVIPYSKKFPYFEILVTYELILRLGIALVIHSYNCFLMQIVAFEDVLCNYLKQSLEIILTSLKVTDEGKIILVRRSYSTREKDEFSPFEKNLRSYEEICEEAENKMRTWVHLHQLLIKFHGVIQEIYGITMCIELFGLLLIFCLVSFMMMNSYLNGPSLLNGAVICINIYTISYLICFYGDLTESSSRNLFRSGFGGYWYVYPRKIRINFQIITMRCRRRMVLMAFGMFPLNSRTYGKVFRHSYSFFMFLVQMVPRSNGEVLF